MLTLEETCQPPTAAYWTRQAVISLHFSPGHVSHLMAWGKLIASLGYQVCFILDRRYFECADFAAIGPAIASDSYQADPGCVHFSTAIFHNAATGNASSARRMRRQGIEVLYVFHEPVPVRMRLSEGWKEILKLIVARFCSIAMLRQSSAVLVASDYARSLYDRHFLKYNPRVHTFPLLFEDEITWDSASGPGADRDCFSFLGRALKAHDFDGFVRFAKYAIRTGSTIPFAVATHTDLSGYLARDPELARYGRQGRIVIQHGKTLSNEEMNSFCARSFCVWNIYKCSTQSGALVRAFMIGTPALAVRAASFPEFIQPGVNGEFVEAAGRLDQMLEAAERIRAHIAIYEQGARRSFLETFHYPANRDRFARILAQTRKDIPQCA